MYYLDLLQWSNWTSFGHIMYDVYVSHFTKSPRVLLSEEINKRIMPLGSTRLPDQQCPLVENQERDFLFESMNHWLANTSFIESLEVCYLASVKLPLEIIYIIFPLSFIWNIFISLFPKEKSLEKKRLLSSKVSRLVHSLCIKMHTFNLFWLSFYIYCNLKSIKTVHIIPSLFSNIFRKATQILIEEKSRWSRRSWAVKPLAGAATCREQIESAMPKPAFCHLY